MCIGAYTPLVIGGWQHPIEINVACFSLWLILTMMFMITMKLKKFEGWRLALGYLIGNAAMVVLGVSRGGYTFNLGLAEKVVLYGIISTVCLWTIVGTVKTAIGTTDKRWDPNIIYWGGITADILSFYPQLKQYFGPHERPTVWLIIGWTLFGVGALVNIIKVERLPDIFVKKEKTVLSALNESAFSIENFVFIILTTIVMAR